MQENTAQTAAEWVFVAKSVAQLPDGQPHALHCMARAGIVAQDVADWLAVAKAWAQDFADVDMGRQCMAKAAYIAGNSEEIDDWIEIAKCWHHSFQDSGNFQRCVREAEEIAEGYDDWVEILAVWDEVFHDVDGDVLTNGIERVVVAAHKGGFFERISEGMAAAVRQQNCLKELGFLPPSTILHQDGTLNSECSSKRLVGSYARYFSFTLPMPMFVTIDLTSNNVDIYLYLIKGSDLDGDVLEENDDWQDGTDSRISRHLAPGTYIIEATTAIDEQIGDFTLVINT